MARGLANEQPTATQTAVPADQAATVRDLIHRRCTIEPATVLAALGLDQPPQ